MPIPHLVGVPRVWKGSLGSFAIDMNGALALMFYPIQLTSLYSEIGTHSSGKEHGELPSYQEYLDSSSSPISMDTIEYSLGSEL